MYLIRDKEVKNAINLEESLHEIMDQLKEMDGRQLEMVKDYIRGLRAAERFLNQG